MDGPKGIHELVGELAKALKNARLPTTKTSEKTDLLNINEPSENLLGLCTSHIATPSCSTALQDDSALKYCDKNTIYHDYIDKPLSNVKSLENLHSTHDQLMLSNVNTSTIFTCNAQDSTLTTLRSHSQASYDTGNQNPIRLEPDSLLNLLSDDTDIYPHSSIECPIQQNTLNQTNNDNASYQSVSLEGVMIRIPEYIQVPAKYFPMIIGSETYVLPYNDNQKTIVLCLNVVLAAGKYIVAKVVGCGSFDPNTSYPEGVNLTFEDEIKVLQSDLCISNMTVDEKISIRELERKQDQAVAEKFDIQRQREPFSNHSVEVLDEEEVDGFNRKYLTRHEDLVGTVVRIPDTNGPGLISYELYDSFDTAPFSTVSSRMVGGETVTFDLAIDRKTKKKEAVRLKLAPLGANLKNAKVAKTRKRNPDKPALKSFEKNLPVIKCPPSIFSEKSFSKQGMLGTIVSLPNKNINGLVKFYTDKTYCRAEYGPPNPNAAHTCPINSFVKFDLVVLFKPDIPFQASNIRLAGKSEVMGHYSLERFICDDSTIKKPWSLPDFKHLMIILRDCGFKRSYDWKTISLQLKKSQQDVRSFLEFFVLQVNKSVANNADKVSSGKRELDNFIRKLTKSSELDEATFGYENTPSSITNERQPVSNGKENNSHIPLPNRPRRSSAKQNAEKGTKSKKSPKESSQQPSAVDSLTSAESTSCHPRSDIPTFFTKHQKFVAKNLMSWQQIPEVSGERTVNSVMGDVMTLCADHVTNQPTNQQKELAVSLPSNQRCKSASSTNQSTGPDYGKLYKYIGVLLGSEQASSSLPTLSDQEAQIMLYLVQDLFDDISKRNLHSHKQFLLARFFDFTAGKNSGRNPINPYKLKGYLLHLPDKRKTPE